MSAPPPGSGPGAATGAPGRPPMGGLGGSGVPPPIGLAGGGPRPPPVHGLHQQQGMGGPAAGPGPVAGAFGGPLANAPAAIANINGNANVVNSSARPNYPSSGLQSQPLQPTMGSSGPSPGGPVFSAESGSPPNSNAPRPYGGSAPLGPQGASAFRPTNFPQVAGGPLQPRQPLGAQQSGPGMGGAPNVAPPGPFAGQPAMVPGVALHSRPQVGSMPNVRPAGPFGQPPAGVQPNLGPNFQPAPGPGAPTFTPGGALSGPQPQAGAPPPVSSAPPANRAKRAFAPVDGPVVADPYTQPQQPAFRPPGGGPMQGVAGGGVGFGGPISGSVNTGMPPMPVAPPSAPQPLQPPQFIQPGNVPFASGAPQPYGASGDHGMDKQAQAGYPGAGVNAVNQLASGFQNMGFGDSKGQATNAIQNVNVMQRPPEVFEFDEPQPTSWMSSQFSISQSPHSNCDPAYKRCTINSIPQTPALLTKSKIPFGLLLTPYRHLHPGDEPVPVINPQQIVRCRRCRTYINPWVQFVENGSRWKCNMCFLTNEVPNFFDWDAETRTRLDRLARPELTHGVVEYIAPQEYMVRPPQPVVFLFIIDVSFQAVQNGTLEVASRTILQTLDEIPNTDSRTKIGFITVDSTIHFYNLQPSLAEPQMLVVSDIEDVFLPMPHDLLVPLVEARSNVERLLTNLPDMFKGTQNSQNVLGRALQAALKMISSIGGKIVIIQSVLPSISDGSLKMREDLKLLGTPKEVGLLQPATSFYKNFAVDCSRTQVSMDVFMTSNQYIDVATLGGCAKFTGGSVYYYPSFDARRREDALKLSKELCHLLSRPIGLEAVLRVRASKGIKMTAFHGNFFLRATDLLSLPNVSPDNSYAIEMTLQDNLTFSMACFQTALLHTSSSGERRIRVLTLSIPVTDKLGDIFASADQFAIAAMLAKKGIERSLTSKIEDAREAIQYKLNEILAAYKTSFTSSGQIAQLILPKNLKLLPILILGLLKNTAFRQSSVIPSDLRSFAMAMMYVYPTELCLISMHPRFYSLLFQHPSVGLPDDNDKIVFPPLLNLSSEKLERHGLYLLDNGSELFIWVGRAVSPELVQMIFDKPSYDQIIAGKTLLPQLENDWSKRVNNIIGKIVELRLLSMTTHPHVYVVKEDGDPNLRTWFLVHLIEDRTENSVSYPQFLQACKGAVDKM